MSWLNYLELAAVIGCVAAYAVIMYFKARGDLAEAALELIAEAEKTGLAGSAKMDQVVRKLAEMVPEPLKKFLPAETLRFLAQKAFDWMRLYALNYMEAKKDPAGEMQALFASNAETTAKLVTELMELAEAALIRRAVENGVDIEPEMTRDQIIQAIIIHYLKAKAG